MQFANLCAGQAQLGENFVARSLSEYVARSGYRAAGGVRAAERVAAHQTGGERAAHEAAEAATKVPGVKWVKLCLSSGDLVYIGENENYAAADALLADSGVQAA